MHKLIIKAFAELDAIDAANWYNEKGEGLGEEFVLAWMQKLMQFKETQLIFKLFIKISEGL